MASSVVMLGAKFTHYLALRCDNSMENLMGTFAKYLFSYNTSYVIMVMVKLPPREVIGSRSTG
jgi:hypothetical protein